MFFNSTNKTLLFANGDRVENQNRISQLVPKRPKFLKKFSKRCIVFIMFFKKNLLKNKKNC